MGDRIFSQGDRATVFCTVLSGQVEFSSTFRCVYCKMYVICFLVQVKIVRRVDVKQLWGNAYQASSALKEVSNTHQLDYSPAYHKLTSHPITGKQLSISPFADSEAVIAHGVLGQPLASLSLDGGGGGSPGPSNFNRKNGNGGNSGSSFVDDDCSVQSGLSSDESIGPNPIASHSRRTHVRKPKAASAKYGYIHLPTLASASSSQCSSPARRKRKAKKFLSSVSSDASNCGTSTVAAADDDSVSSAGNATNSTNTSTIATDCPFTHSNAVSNFVHPTASHRYITTEPPPADMAEGTLSIEVAVLGAGEIFGDDIFRSHSYFSYGAIAMEDNMEVIIVDKIEAALCLLPHDIQQLVAYTAQLHIDDISLLLLHENGIRQHLAKKRHQTKKMYVDKFHSFIK